MEKMTDVPDDLITGKDLDYLSDMFQWNYIAYKKTCNDISSVEDETISNVMDEAINIFDNNMNLVLNIISNPGGDIDG